MERERETKCSIEYQRYLVWARKQKRKRKHSCQKAKMVRLTPNRYLRIWSANSWVRRHGGRLRKMQIVSFFFFAQVKEKRKEYHRLSRHVFVGRERHDEWAHIGVYSSSHLNWFNKIFFEKARIRNHLLGEKKQFKFKSCNHICGREKIDWTAAIRTVWQLPPTSFHRTNNKRIYVSKWTWVLFRLFFFFFAFGIHFYIASSPLFPSDPVAHWSFGICDTIFFILSFDFMHCILRMNVQTNWTLDFMLPPPSNHQTYLFLAFFFFFFFHFAHQSVHSVTI